MPSWPAGLKFTPAKSTCGRRPWFSAQGLELMDRQYLKTPFYGSRRMAVWLRSQGHQVNRKRVRRLMQVMALEAIYRRPNPDASGQASAWAQSLSLPAERAGDQPDQPGVGQAPLWVSLSEHSHLPRPGYTTHAASPHYPYLAPTWRGVFTKESSLPFVRRLINPDPPPNTSEHLVGALSQKG